MTTLVVWLSGVLCGVVAALIAVRPRRGTLDEVDLGPDD